MSENLRSGDVKCLFFATYQETKVNSRTIARDLPVRMGLTYKIFTSASISLK